MSAVDRLDDAGPKISFGLQIHSSNKDNPESNPVTLNFSIVARSKLDLRGVSHPSQVVLPFPRWEPKEKPLKEDDVGPQVTHIYESLSRLNCEYRTVNDSRLVMCDLGNPMVSGTQRGKGSTTWEGVSHPSQVVLPFPRWEPKEKPLKEDDVGPQVTHIYELHNAGPSSTGEAELQVGWPSRFRDENLLYAMEITTDGPISCRANGSLNPLGLQLSALQDTPELLGFLRNVSSASHRRYRRAAAEEHDYNSKTLRRNDPYLLNSTVSFMMGTLVLWGTPDVSFAVPLWVIILAILLGLLVLAMLTLAMWKCGFFDRARPPVDDDISDREQLTSNQSADA
ncbi:hypothetical protein CRUP_034624 [Coryphaenoides rupestris]|nr:hypothetical protein CRUP_034624 [Coryphaenoides rupestris]